MVEHLQNVGQNIRVPCSNFKMTENGKSQSVFPRKSKMTSSVALISLYCRRLKKQEDIHIQEAGIRGF